MKPLHVGRRVATPGRPAATPGRRTDGLQRPPDGPRDQASRTSPVTWDSGHAPGGLPNHQVEIGF